MKKIISILLVLTMAIGCAGCRKKSPGNVTGSTKVSESADSGERLQVYTSFYAMYDFAKLIVGDAADVHLLCPPGGEVHDYEPTTADMAKLTEADVFIYNGGGMEHWASKIADTLGETEVVCTSAGLTKEGASDPHIWLDPAIAQLQIEKIYDAIATADVANAEIYTQNYSNCVEMLAELKLAYEEALAETALDTIVVGHGAYSYLCDAYGIEQLAIEGSAGESDPSPADMAKVVDEAREKGIKYVCAEELGSSKVVESAAAEIGAEVVSLNPFEGAVDGEGYFEVMYGNLEVLTKVLN